MAHSRVLALWSACLHLLAISSDSDCCPISLWFDSRIHYLFPWSHDKDPLSHRLKVLEFTPAYQVNSLQCTFWFLPGFRSFSHSSSSSYCHLQITILKMDKHPQTTLWYRHLPVIPLLTSCLERFLQFLQSFDESKAFFMVFFIVTLTDHQLKSLLESFPGQV